MRAVLLVELIKLSHQWKMRIALLGVALAPPLVTLVLQAQTGLPTDTLYGRWVQEIGLALPLVVLGSAAVWGIPVLVSLVAGDILGSEDAHGTWAVLLTRSRTRWQLLAGKAVAAALVSTLLVVVLATSAIASGVLIVGTQDLVGLTGQPLQFGNGLLLVVTAWASTLPTALALACGALLASAASRSSVVGVVVPAVVALGLALLSLLAPLGAARPLLLVPGLQAWHGLLQEPQQVAPVLAAAGVAAAWSALLLAATVLVLRRRDWAVP